MKDNVIIDNLVQELKRGTLVLAVLLNSSKPSYGYSMINTLKDLGIEIEQNTLYPLLRRLEKQGLLESSWDTTDSRPRKYYIISEMGKGIRDSLYNEWNKTNKVIETMVVKGE
ncbi:MAG: PadR family transcriptional regulator [Spirochaetales bacterium]|nr:PadR family transcriptional regulator [Spirochaetales bacterium]